MRVRNSSRVLLASTLVLAACSGGASQSPSTSAGDDAGEHGPNPSDADQADAPGSVGEPVDAAHAIDDSAPAPGSGDDASDSSPTIPGADATAPSDASLPAPRCSAGCGTHRWACWPMPNPAASGLPNAASYADNGDGTITDKLTCLRWRKSASSTTYSVVQARAYCASLGAGWRLATRIEMMSIDDFTKSGAKVDAAFGGSPAAFFKTGSEWVLTTKQIGAGKGTDFGWAFNFSDGITSNARSGATPDYARCVRGGGDGDLDAAPGALAVAPPNQYTAIATGEVRDNYTGLVWQQDFSSAAMPWSGAAAYCAGLRSNGHAWRVPSIRELSTLVDESQVAPAINRTMFPNTKYGSKSDNWYWASHQAVGSSAAWAINFDDGFTGFNAGASGAWNYFTAAWVRCVR